jgi:hypothetical protein
VSAARDSPTAAGRRAEPEHAADRDLIADLQGRDVHAVPAYERPVGRCGIAHREAHARELDDRVDARHVRLIGVALWNRNRVARGTADRTATRDRKARTWNRLRLEHSEAAQARQPQGSRGPRETIFGAEVRKRVGERAATARIRVGAESGVPLGTLCNVPVRVLDWQARDRGHRWPCHRRRIVSCKYDQIGR